MPLLAVAAAGMARSLGMAQRVFVGALIAVQVVINAVVWNDPKILWEDGNGSNALTQALPQLAALFGRLPTWYLSDASVWPFVLAFVTWAVVSAWLLKGVAHHRVLPARSAPDPDADSRAAIASSGHASSRTRSTASAMRSSGAKRALSQVVEPHRMS